LPFPEFGDGPLVRFVFVAGGAWVGDAGLLGLNRRDEAEGVGADEVVLDGLLDARHVTGDTLASGAVCGVMRVFRDGALEACGVLAGVAGEADLVAASVEAGGVFVAVNLVAVEAANLAVVHVALDIVVALHAVFVRGKIGELVEVGCAGLELFELPVVDETLAHLEADGPIVVFALDGIA